MIRINDLSLGFGTRILYNHVNLLANPGERIALVGENGSGKSTLFASILDELDPEAGSIDKPGLSDIAYVAQTVEALEIPALDFVIEGHWGLVQAKANLVKAQESGENMVLAQALSELGELNEGAIRAQAQSVMAGLGFSESDSQNAVRDFSGGWRNRLALARALMAPSTLLLLDEPTNHLDIDSLIWLENWLRHIDSTVIIISHDREFLDRTTGTTWAIEDDTIKRYGGNYSFYEHQRLEQLQQQDAAFKAYERKKTHLSAYIERFRYKATKARQAQSRIKMLEKLETLEPVRRKRRWRFEFFEPERMPEHLIDLSGIDLGYGDRTVLKRVNLSIRAGERIGVLGVNGAGKSTLIKAIAGTLAPFAGEIRYGEGAKVGYFAQHQLEQLDGTETAYEALRHKAPEEREQTLRDYLGRFRFSGESIDQKIGVMSGGEKARLALALIAWDRPNILVLDEPTNHLDMSVREALTVALADFEGALLLVSHDRHLLKTCAERLILVHEGQVTEYEGDLDDYATLVLEHRKSSAKAQRVVQPLAEDPQVNRKEQRRIEAQQRAELAAKRKPLLNRLQKVEKEMQASGEQLKAIDSTLADAEWYRNASPDILAQTLKERGELATLNEKLESEWLDLSEAIEQLGN